MASNPKPNPGFPCPIYGACIKVKHCRSKGRPSCPQTPNGHDTGRK